jgi:predicted porin
VSPALVLGTSFARGAFVGRGALAAAGVQDTGEYLQQAVGVDASYEAGHLMVRGEVIGTAWHLPLARSSSTLDLRAAALSIEAKYAFLPGAYAAARAERLTFNRVTGSQRTDAWEAPVDRLEIGGGYYLQRNLIARASLQFNQRGAGRVTSSRLAAAQLLFWF